MNASAIGSQCGGSITGAHATARKKPEAAQRDHDQQPPPDLRGAFQDVADADFPQHEREKRRAPTTLAMLVATNAARDAVFRHGAIL